MDLSSEFQQNVPTKPPLWSGFQCPSCKSVVFYIAGRIVIDNNAWENFVVCHCGNRGRVITNA